MIRLVKLFNYASMLLLGFFVSPVNADSLIGENKSMQDHINITGASYARGWNIDQVLCLPVINTGMDGQQSTEVAERFEKDVISGSPKAVIIWGFINDLHRNPKENVETTIENAKQSMRSMVASAKAKGVIPVLATEVTLGVSKSLKWRIMSFIGKIRGKQSYQAFINGHVLAVNQWIRDYAEQNDILVLDVEKVMTNDEGNRKEGFALEDGSHITLSAYEALTKYSMPVLKQKLVEQNNLCL